MTPLILKQDLSRFFHTVRHLRLEQVVFQLYYRLAKPWVRRRALAPVGEVTRRPWVNAWSAPLVIPRCHLAPGVCEFLGERGRLESAADWNATDKNKLWLYNLHYLDDLNSAEADTRVSQQTWLIQRWIDDNPAPTGNGWEPYPISLRLVNLVKWCARQEDVPVLWLDSMARQARALAVQEERHILANHLFANGKALVFVGAFFDESSGGDWLTRGLGILDREIPEQFLSDGGHFELSPMYHAILLWDLCDLVNLAERSGLPQLTERAASWKGVIERGSGWLAAMCHPDGEIGFFNDATIGIAPAPKAVRQYSEMLGCDVKDNHGGSFTCRHLTDTGYVVVSLDEDGKAILDVAEIGPSYQPGHAHADSLSFELSLFGQRVLVNSGISQYGEDEERLRQRGTAAHNTVEIDGEDSSELWGGFRAARRAYPIGLEVRVESDEIGVRCSHDGYRSAAGAPIHRREWKFDKAQMRVSDLVEGGYREAVARYYLHPDVQLLDAQTLGLPGGGRVHWSSTGGQAQLVSATWHPQFGVSIPNNCIEIRFTGPECQVEFSWG